MQAHVTCGRGTEVFVKDELLDKLKCQVMSVEDGKVFFTVSELEPAADNHYENMFDLKTAERIFVTVTHFPTCDIKGNGKVRFLQALKDRILNFSHLGKAVKDAQQLQTVQRMIKQSDQEKDARHTFECHEQAPDQLSECPSGSDEHTYSHTSKTPNRKYLPQHPDQKCDFQMKPSTLVNKLSENTQAASRILQKNKCGELHKHPCSGGHPAGSHDQVQGISISKSITVQEDPQDCILAGPPEKRQKLDIKPVPGSYTDSQGKGGTKSSMTIPAKQQTESVSGVQGRGSDSVTSFRFSVKCGGWCKKWLKPQRLAKELGIRLSIMMGWTVDLHTPHIEFCIHMNDDFVTAGIPLTRVPLSKRAYILDAGLRSTVSWIMASQAQIQILSTILYLEDVPLVEFIILYSHACQPGHCVLDPMCGKATILVEAAREHWKDAEFIGCDLDEHQLQTAAKNVKFAQLSQCLLLIQADALNMPLKSASVDRIVCDAPFGQKFAVASKSLPQFYKGLILEMYRLLVPGGIAVLLTSQVLLPVVEENIQKISHSANPTPQAPPSRSMGQMEADLSKNQSQESHDLVFSENLMSQTKNCLTVGGLNETSDQTDGADAAPSVKNNMLDQSSAEVIASSSTVPCAEVRLVRGTAENKICSQVTTHTPSTSCANLETKLTQQTENQTESKTSDLANASIQGPNSAQASTDINSETSSSTVQKESDDLSQSVRTSSMTNSMMSYCGGVVGGNRKAVSSQSSLFSLLSSHYIKLGETHAYIVVLQKPELDQDAVFAWV